MGSVPPARTLAHFVIERHLATGGMAEVFLARKEGAEGTSKRLVVKRILPGHGSSLRFRTMFIEEAQLATQLNHPNLVQVYEFFDGGEEGHVLAMEYVEGSDLGQLMRAARDRGERIGPYLSAWIVAEAAKGLHYAHEKKDEEGRALEIVHRDVSPQNVLLSNDGVVKITDFGIASARVVVEEAGVIKGKFGYMAPEQARGEKVDRRADLYALGVILWECLTGRALHGGLSGDALLDMVRAGLVDPPSLIAQDVPPELEAIAMKMLAATPSERFATAREVAQALGRLLLGHDELIDAGTLEQRMLELAPSPPAPDEPRELSESTQADGLAARARVEPERPSGMLEGSKRRAAREVRHVVLLSLRLEIEGGKSPEHLSTKDARALAQLRRMLTEMAYKHGAQWQWSSATRADAVAGLLASHSRAPLDAADLARQTHEAIEGYADELSVKVRASISMVRGIASGVRDRQGNLEQFAVHEPAPRIAVSVLSSTPSGSTWVAGGLYRLIRHEHLWGERALVQVDGDHASGPMKVYELLRALSREERRQASVGHDLVGRNAERADLASAYHHTSKENGRLMVRAVVGELGIGKSALVSSFLAELPESTSVVQVECTPVHVDVPFRAIGDLVRAAFSLTGEESLDAVSDQLHAAFSCTEADLASGAVRKLAELASQERAPTHARGEAIDARHEICVGVSMLLDLLTRSQPLVLVLESFQWADRQSIEVLSEVLVPGEQWPALAIVVTRPEERLARLLERKVRIELSALKPDDQVRLIEQRLGVTAGVRDACAELLPRAAGNPFFLLEMVDAWLERHQLEIREEASAGGGAPRSVLAVGAASAAISSNTLPQTLEQLLRDRMSELADDELQLLQHLAVFGGPMTLEALTSLLHLDPLDTLARLGARGLLDQRGAAYDFRHPLMRDVVYSTLNPEHKQQLHRELGEYLSSTPYARGTAAAIVARHFLRADQPARAGVYFLEAAEAARAGNENTLSLKHYERARACLSSKDAGGDADLLLRVLAGMEDLQRVLGRPRERSETLQRLLQLAKQVNKPRAAGTALLRRARFALDTSDLQRGAHYAKLAAQLAHDTALPLMAIDAESLLSELLRESGDVQGALAACDRAWAACSPDATSGVTALTRSEVLTIRGVLLRRVGRVREAVDAYVDAIAFARRAQAKRLEARTSNALAYALFVQGRYEDAIALGLETIALDRASGSRLQFGKTLTNIAQSYARLGERERAVAYFDRAQLAFDKSGTLDGRADMAIVRALLAIEYNDLDGAHALLEQSRAITSASANAYDLTHEKMTRAAYLRTAQRPGEAVALALEARREAERQSLVAFHFTALALEGLSRVEMGEAHAGTLLATTALGAVEHLQGCEFGLEIRMMCSLALHKAGSPQAEHAIEHAREAAHSTLALVRDPRLARSFRERPYVAAMLRGPRRGPIESAADAHHDASLHTSPPVD